MSRLINTKISKMNHEKLKNFSDGSIDKNLNLLMDVVEQHMPFVNYSDEMKSINVYDDTLKRLDGFHITSSESRDNILTRMFIAFEEIDNFGQEDWIPFKLTSTLNKKLSIEGQVEYHSRDMLFNEEGKVLGYALPTTYSYEGENLTREFISWQKMINWSEVLNMILNNHNNKQTIEHQNYVLEINYI